MPYKDREAKRRCQREWLQSQRAAFFADKSCVDCGSTDRLELDHVDKTQKVSHKIWSWAPMRRNAEIAKCVIRCRDCHVERHAAERRQAHGQGAYKRGCRCDYCRACNAAKARRYNAKRRGRESDPRERLCRPSPNHSATAPESLTLFDLEVAA